MGSNLSIQIKNSVTLVVVPKHINDKLNAFQWMCSNECPWNYSCLIPCSEAQQWNWIPHLFHPFFSMLSDVFTEKYEVFNSESAL